MLKKLTLISLTLLLVLAWASVGTVSAADVVKIGIFDLQQAITKSKQGQAVKAKLMTKFERLQKELKLKEAELDKLKKELDTQSAMLSPEAKYDKEKTLKRKVRDFQDQYRDYSEEMKREEMEVTKPVVNGLLQSANSYGKAQGFTLILEASKAGVIYAPDAIDITDEVVKQYDSGK